MEEMIKRKRMKSNIIIKCYLCKWQLWKFMKISEKKKNFFCSRRWRHDEVSVILWILIQITYKLIDICWSFNTFWNKASKYFKSIHFCWREIHFLESNSVTRVFPSLDTEEYSDKITTILSSILSIKNRLLLRALCALWTWKKARSHTCYLLCKIDGWISFLL